MGFAPTAHRAVALCIAPPAADSRRLVDEVEIEFAQLFSAEAHLDIIFVDPHEEEDLMRVCRAFYTKGPS